MEEIFSPSLVSAVRLAKSMAHKEQHLTYGVAHLALALLLEPTGLEDIMRSMGKDVDYIQEWFEVRKESYIPEKNDESIIPDSEVTRVFDEAERSKLKLGTDYIDAVCVFTAIVREGVVYDNKQLETIMVSEQDFLDQYNAPQNYKFVENETTEETLQGINFCKNLLTADYSDEGEIIVGRDKEIRHTLENLERQENSGMLIIGDSGVGKTGFLNALIYHLWNSTNPQHGEISVIGLNTSKLLANSATPSEVAKKLSDIFDKIQKINNCILVIDDIHTLTEGNQTSNAVINLIASELNEGKVRLIATITGDAYRKTIEKHPINRKLDVIQLEELEPLLLKQCMENHRIKLTAHYELKISEQAIDESVQFSKRYFKESKLPHEAISLLDKTMAAVKMSNDNTAKNCETILKKLKAVNLKANDALVQLKYLYKLILDQISPVVLSKITTNYDIDSQAEPEALFKIIEAYLKEINGLTETPIKEVTENEVTAIVASVTGIPIGKIQAEEKERLLNIEEKLEERVKGQNHAIKTLSDAIIEARSGLSNPKQPIGSFFFLGPTGTGKTELTKSLAELLFDDENAMIRFDMSEFKEEHSAALLYGAPPGYVGYEEGGMLVNKIRQKPYSVVLFDEIEKAHSSVYDVFLQIMDEGQIHDKLGREGDFSNAIIIFTSNIGSDWVAEQMRAGKIPSSNQLIDIMSKNFRPEFLGRLTEVVPFAPIHEKVAELIFGLHLNNLQKQLLQQKNIDLSLTEDALSYLSKKGYSEKYGARPIAGVIRTYIKKIVSRMIVAQNIIEGDSVRLDYKDESLAWEKVN
ncbi:Clp protease ClpA [Flavivirga aquatica]|uniref:Clp protease ClpA n=1 Tax=Flavivirga aquatica TaxID=1849968 RepID=A0A1E5TEM7_9FLAO|nr:ATP-dependent Clp protease ATP-binding subunit [Flavivirga aquatica]OEK09822.1 Clp protease ClpA [Flavivirga aquatica]